MYDYDEIEFYKCLHSLLLPFIFSREIVMHQNDTKVPKLPFVLHQDAWFSGIDNSMKMLGSAQFVTSDDMIRLQNAALRDCWAVTGNHLRQAMFALSKNTNIYPEELKDDSACRKIMTRMKAKV